MRERQVYSLKLERVGGEGIEATCVFVVNTTKHVRRGLIYGFG